MGLRKTVGEPSVGRRGVLGSRPGVFRSLCVLLLEKIILGYLGSLPLSIFDLELTPFVLVLYLPGNLLIFNSPPE